MDELDLNELDDQSYVGELIDDLREFQERFPVLVEHDDGHLYEIGGIKRHDTTYGPVVILVLGGIVGTAPGGPSDYGTLGPPPWSPEQ